MIYIILTIILIGIGLFIGSFFFSDKLQQLEDQLEQFSLSTMQDTYQIKKKLNVLEEELLTNEPIPQPISTKQEVPPRRNEDLTNKPLLVQKIHHLHEQGFSIDDIARQTNLTPYDVQTILKHQM